MAKVRTWLATAVVGLAGCKGQLVREHESLARALAEPAGILCRVETGEAGGCHGDCPTRNAANNGVAFARASRLLRDLPRSRDPDTEADVAAVRASAAEVTRGIGPACRKPAGGEALDVEARACAHVYRNTWNARGQLLDALGSLRDAALHRSGVELPDHRRCANQ